MKFTKDHEWVLVNGNIATIGITQYAADALGELVYVELPNIGNAYEVGKPFAVVESSKSASDVYMPISGKIVEVNSSLDGTPELINNSPLQDGWIAKVEITNDSLLNSAMNEEEYKNFLQNQ